MNDHRRVLRHKPHLAGKHWWAKKGLHDFYRFEHRIETQQSSKITSRSIKEVLFVVFVTWELQIRKMLNGVVIPSVILAHLSRVRHCSRLIFPKQGPHLFYTVSYIQLHHEVITSVKEKQNWSRFCISEHYRRCAYPYLRRNTRRNSTARVLCCPELS